MKYKIEKVVYEIPVEKVKTNADILRYIANADTKCNNASVMLESDSHKEAIEFYDGITEAKPYHDDYHHIWIIESYYFEEYADYGVYSSIFSKMDYDIDRFEDTRYKVSKAKEEISRQIAILKAIEDFNGFDNNEIAKRAIDGLEDCFEDLEWIEDNI